MATVVPTQETPKIAPTVPVAGDTTAGKQASVAKTAPASAPAATAQPNQPRLVHAALTGLRVRHHRHGLRHRAAIAALAFPKAKAQSLVEEAKLEIPDGRFRFTIEGDQTAVAYDAQTGVVSTDGPGLFVVEKATGDAPILRPQSTPSNVHYKCDQDANCSLIMASMVVPHARMRTVSHTTDWAYVPVSTDGQGRDTSQAPVYFGHVSR
jgi:hypothetical protein